MTKNNNKKYKNRLCNSFAIKFAKSKVSHVISDKLFLRIQYFCFVGNILHIKNPRTFNEKLQWLKLYDRNPTHTNLVDKYLVKEIITEKLGEKHVIPTLGVWNTFDEIDFSILPDKFVLKCTHDSGSVIVCKDKSKLDIEEAKTKLESGLNSNLFYWGREWPYKNLKPRIIAEAYLEDKNLGDLRDYKFFCFNGKVKCFKVDFDRFIDHRANYFDTDGNLLRFGELVCPPDFNRNIELPRHLKEMIAMAEALSKDEAFVRVDFYEVEDNIYFGELTFFPAAGFGPFVPEEWDYKLGSWIDISNIKKRSGK